MDTWPESLNAPTAPPWWASGFWAACAGVPKKGCKMGHLSQALLALLSPPLVAMLFQKPSKKRPKTTSKRGVKEA